MMHTFTQTVIVVATRSIPDNRRNNYACLGHIVHTGIVLNDRELINQDYNGTGIHG